MGWEFLTCVHGVQEGLDSHSCCTCQTMAVKLGYDTSNSRTYIFTRRSLNLMKRKEPEKYEKIKDYV